MTTQPLVIVVILYYLIILGTGLWAARKLHIPAQDIQKDSSKEDYTYSRKLFLADQRMGRWFGALSLAASWVGGGYLCGSAEVVYKYGALWCQTPVGYALSLVLAGWLFGDYIKNSHSVTLMDPFQKHLGKWIALFLLMPCIFGEILWSSAILHALGASVHILTGTDPAIIIVSSVAVVVTYTALGGLCSVMYTDIIQAVTVLAGMWICLPFCVLRDIVGKTGVDWTGTVSGDRFWEYLDTFLMTAFGGIPWQVYFQRVLNSANAVEAKIMSYASAFGCIAMTIPSMWIGAAARKTNFTLAGYQTEALEGDDATNILATALSLLAPPTVGILCLIAIAASAMSSVDSSVLSLSTFMSRNLYYRLARPSAEEREIAAALRVSICIVGTASICTALTTSAINSLWMFSSDLVYVLLFPQFICIFNFPSMINSYGSFCSFFVGLLIRALIGEESVGIPIRIRYPFHNQKGAQRFPYRTFCMGATFGFLVIFSEVARVLFEHRILPPCMDICRCFRNDRKSEYSTKGDTHTEARSHVSGGLLESAVPTPRSSSTFGPSRTVPDRGNDPGNMSPAEFLANLRRKLSAKAESASKEAQNMLPWKISPSPRRRSRGGSPRKATPRGPSRRSSKLGALKKVPPVGTPKAAKRRMLKKPSPSASRKDTPGAGTPRKGSMSPLWAATSPSRVRPGAAAEHDDSGIATYAWEQVKKSPSDKMLMKHVSK